MRQTRPLFTLAAWIAISASLTQPLWALTPGACRDDVEKFCLGKRGQEALICINEHAAQLSPTCQTNLGEARQMLYQVAAICRPEIQRFCSVEQPNKGRILDCLKKHERDLSPECLLRRSMAKSHLNAAASAAPMQGTGDGP